MGEDRLRATITCTCVMLVGYAWFVLFYYQEKYGGSEPMNEIITDYGALLTVIVTLAGVVGILISQVIFYRKDSKTMDEIKQNLSTGTNRLENRVEHEKELLTVEHSRLSKEHSRLSKEHMDIRDIVKEVRTKQEAELKLQEKIKDIVPDAGMLKNGIDKILQENVSLKIELLDLRNEIQQLKEKNKEMLQELQQSRNRSNGRTK